MLRGRPGAGCRSNRPRLNALGFHTKPPIRGRPIDWSATVTSRRLPAVAIGGLGLGLGLVLLAAGLMRPPTVVKAQPTDLENALALYGRRYVVPLPQAPQMEAQLAVANIGWEDTGLAVVALAEAGATACPAPFAPGSLVAVSCGAKVPGSSFVELPVRAAGASHLFVYSIGGDAPAACRALGDVESGALALAAWERTTWEPGAPVAVTLKASSAAGSTAVTGQPAIIDMVPGLAGRLGSRAWGLPMVEEDGHTAALVINASPQCTAIESATAPLYDGDCPTAQVATTYAPPYSARRTNHATPGGVVVAAPRPLAGLVEHQAPKGWYTYGLTPVIRDVRQVYFPLAAGPLEGMTSELWVTNNHVTATTTINLIMTNANGQVTKLVRDDVPLCPLSTRKYDVTDLAGEIPRQGRNGPPMLSLSVSSTNLDLPQAPPISAAILLETSLGTAAYAGFTSLNPLAALGVGRRDDIQGTPVIAVPGVKMAYGQPQATTALVVQAVRGGNVTRMYIDFIDADGKLVMDDAYFAARSDGGLLIDLAQPMGKVGGGDRSRLPAGFMGTALIRPEARRATLAVLAFDHAAGDRRGPTPRAGAPSRPWWEQAPDQGDQVSLSTVGGLQLLRPPDPNAPTATTAPTRAPRATPTSIVETAAVFLPSVRLGVP